MNDSNQGPLAKRPYATLDLKATEIKVTPIGESNLGQRPSTDEQEIPFAGPVPRPLPARAYVMSGAAGESASRTASSQTGGKTAIQGAASSNGHTGGAGTETGPEKVRATMSSAYGPATPSDLSGSAQTTIINKKRGGFFSHLAAGIAGGIAALAAWHWGLQELTERGYLAGLPLSGGDTTAISMRLDRIEKSQGVDELVTKLQNAEARLAEVEKAATAVTEIKEAQSRFVAEAKAMLAATASDQGAPDQIERLATLEQKLSDMSEAGTNDPNIGRMEQELAAIKSDASRIEERLSSLKGESDRALETLSETEAELTSLKSSHQLLTNSVAKLADIATAVDPVYAKLAALESGLADVQQAEAERRVNAERVVLSLELQNLKRALDRGQSYESELAEVEMAAGGKLDLAPLAKFKDQGVPTVADLNRNFRPSANAIIDADAEPDDGSVVDRLIAGAKSVVRVRKVNHDAGDKSVEAVAARMEAAMKDGRLADVIAEADALSPKAKEAAQPFLDKVSARASVDKAIASLEEQLKSSLSGGPPPHSATE